MILPHSVTTNTRLWVTPVTLAATALEGGGGASSVVAGVTTTILLRGGEFFAKQENTHLDISRVRMRLEGLQAYGALCALLANGCLRLYSSVSERDAKGSGSKKMALNLFFVAVVLSILSGSYTTVVFTLIPLYSKTALGRGYDQQFLQFWTATANLRETGLLAFLCCLVSFEVAFCLSLFIRTTGKRQKLLVVLSSALAVMSFVEWTSVMRLGAQFLFPFHAEAEY